MIVAVQNQQTAYLHIEGDIPADLDEGVFISVARKPALKIYSLGFQPAKSIPEIPRWFLHKYARKPFTVLDPFAGSGTTIIESLKYGASVYWLDYHPLSRLICRVKTTFASPSEVLQSASAIIQTAENQKYAPNTVHFANKDFWFQQQVQEGLEIIREHIEATKITIQPILWLAFASTVRKTSNMNDGMLLAAKRSRFEEIPKRSRSDVFRYFLQYVEKAVEAIAEWHPFLEKSINNVEELPFADARNLSGDWLCDAIVTSPPYINAIDYVWAAKFELHWLGMVESDRERLDLYSKEIGTERIPRDWSLDQSC
ncbi:hypothetical protein H6S82_05240 [Planktothrix sp. FACHB-1355]|uniref:site-specific DNA-methyltransferase (cytosine-N(4)-specific) n=1 Tax=Aerosakkonema funiforme FACHB-1375 TaxID=2949571 RepID=A0A926ZFZ7_9CYAN|nr:MULTISPECIES: hypothetical protein [Oscillatoriales]MBD2181400.1 hypothetical protein [Aerosakkonema funiforme FACHB-1375]MBD3558260.1 hypothetical protein [Planktothrix sp. FACHB-1355]